ncbi:MAG TPA: NAD(P)/FAD-dependent oxidoreductase [Pseudonocardiaceae bacterium]|jgi:thioredoxin reductase (NADPH)|nr:NAD(P)/FAD-dependent oxidoreductase [Pseudonocardiaceae bacterium]
MDLMLDVDVLVVGAGPAGLYAAYYAGFRGLRTALVDSLPKPGGQVAALYPEKKIYDIAGFPSVRGRDLVAALVAQAQRFTPTWLLGQSAAELSRTAGGRLAITTTDGTELITSSIVIAGGIGTFTPRPLPAGGDYVGRGVDYFVTDPDDYTGQHVVVVGGGDSALDWALALEPIAESVTLTHRRPQFTAHEASVAQLRTSTASIRTPCVVHEVGGRAAVEYVVLRDTRSGEVTELHCTRIVAALGFTANLGPLQSWGLRITDRHIEVDSRMSTGVPGIYAAGDITDYPGKVRLISVGFGEAALAVNNAAAAASPAANLFPGHSSETAA